MLFWAKPKKGRPISKITDRTAIQQTSPLRQKSKIPKHTKSLCFAKPTPIATMMMMMMMSILIRDSFWPEPGASAARRLSMGMAGGARDPPPEAVGGAPSHAHRQPSSGGGARRRPEGPRDMGAFRSVGRPDTHFTKAY